MTEAEFSRRVGAMEQQLYRTSFSILKNDSDCKDAAQEAICRAWLRVGKLRDENSFPVTKTPEYINILLTDTETPGVYRSNLAVDVGAVFGKNGKENIKYLFDAAPDCDKAVVQLAPRGADE